MTNEVERVSRSELELTRRDVMSSSAVAAAGAMGISAAQSGGPTDEISGTVTDTDGNTVSGATVVAVPHDESLEPLVTTTDSTGSYVFPSSDLHPYSNLYHVIARDGTESDPMRGQQNYPFIAATGQATVPDSAIYHYDYSEISGTDGDVVSTLPDQLGNLDLAGNSVLRTNDKNGLNVGQFDGTDDGHISNDNREAQPNTIIMTVQVTGSSGVEHALVDSEASQTSNSRHYVRWSGAGGWQIFAGSATVGGGTFDNDWHVWTARFDGSNSILRQDGTTVASGDPGSNDLAGAAVGVSGVEDSYGQIKVGEVVYCNTGLSGTDMEEEEQRQAGKWGITL